MTAIIEESMGNRLLPRIVLIACGSFSPPTPMHLRMFEIARDFFEMHGTHHVIGGIISPTHDSYGKTGLAPSTHRLAMLKLAVQSSTWIRISDWETKKSAWSRTQSVLQYHQNFMNNYINSPDVEDGLNGHIPSWLPEQVRQRRDPVHLKLLCGADLLESFAVPGLWSNEDIEDIVANHGLVVISRSGANPEKFIFESDVLTKHQRNIHLVTNWVPNEVSSSMIRRLLSRGQSVKYLLDDLVLQYIQAHGLFNCKSKYITDFVSPTAAAETAVTTTATRKDFQNVFNREYINQKNMIVSSMHHTPDEEGDDDDENVDDNCAEELMDETDYSIKNILTSINLDKSKSKVFCCADAKNNQEHVTTKLSAPPQRRSGPGQAVQVITTECGTGAPTTSLVREITGEETQAKKLKINATQL